VIVTHHLGRGQPEGISTRAVFCKPKKRVQHCNWYVDRPSLTGFAFFPRREPLVFQVKAATYQSSNHLPFDMNQLLLWNLFPKAAFSRAHTTSALLCYSIESRVEAAWHFVGCACRTSQLEMTQIGFWPTRGLLFVPGTAGAAANYTSVPFAQGLKQ